MVTSNIESDIKHIILANGLAWSPDNRTLYLADTRHPAVWAFDFDLDSGKHL